MGAVSEIPVDRYGVLKSSARHGEVAFLIRDQSQVVERRRRATFISTGTAQQHTFLERITGRKSVALSQSQNPETVQRLGPARFIRGRAVAEGALQPFSTLRQ